MVFRYDAPGRFETDGTIGRSNERFRSTQMISHRVVQGAVAAGAGDEAGQGDEIYCSSRMSGEGV